MTKRYSNYWTVKSQEVLKLARARLRQGPASTFDLMEATGKSNPRTRDYLMFLRSREEVICVREAVISPATGSSPALWAMNPAFDPASVEQRDEDQVDTFPRRVVVRRSGDWEPNHVRMWMDCYLFGVPAVLQREAA